MRRGCEQRLRFGLAALWGGSWRGRTAASGAIIEQLSGVPADRFTGFHDAASTGMADLLRPLFDKQRLSRITCLACTSGEPVTTATTFGSRSAFARNLARWRRDQRFAAADPVLIKAERHARLLVASGSITQEMLVEDESPCRSVPRPTVRFRHGARRSRVHRSTAEYPTNWLATRHDARRLSLRRWRAVRVRESHSGPSSLGAPQPGQPERRTSGPE